MSLLSPSVLDANWTQKAGRGGEPSRVTPCNSNRPGRNRSCNPRFGSAAAATPALKRLLILKDLASGHRRRRRWTTPALALILALRTRLQSAWLGELEPPTLRWQGVRSPHPDGVHPVVYDLR